MQFKIIITSGLSASAVAELRLQALATDPDAFGDQHTLASRRTPEEWEAWLAERANGSDRALFVLAKDGVYAGMCGAGLNRTSAGRGFIWGVYVRPEYRGQGGADLLMAAAHDWLAARGALVVEAKVAAPNEVAIRFYRRIGYEVLPQAGTLRDGSSIPVYPIRINLAGRQVSGRSGEAVPGEPRA
jgi:ribosomal protein S18 acetylase RimI-like enzyme